jgi:hypothetical protein
MQKGLPVEPSSYRVRKHVSHEAVFRSFAPKSVSDVPREHHGVSQAIITCLIQ